eukprot:scaffold2380_cov102-Isochrysis_galbana.AAC.6
MHRKQPIETKRRHSLNGPHTAARTHSCPPTQAKSPTYTPKRFSRGHLQAVPRPLPESIIRHPQPPPCRPPTSATPGSQQRLRRVAVATRRSAAAIGGGGGRAT